MAEFFNDGFLAMLLVGAGLLLFPLPATLFSTFAIVKARGVPKEGIHYLGLIIYCCMCILIQLTWAVWMDPRHGWDELTPYLFLVYFFGAFLAFAIAQAAKLDYDDERGPE